MAPHKCNYIVFSNNKYNQEEALSIKLFGKNINKSENPNFLGIRFDKYFHKFFLVLSLKRNIYKHRSTY
jgi:hypothetical protein